MKIPSDQNDEFNPADAMTLIEVEQAAVSLGQQEAREAISRGHRGSIGLPHQLFVLANQAYVQAGVEPTVRVLEGYFDGYNSTVKRHGHPGLTIEEFGADVSRGIYLDGAHSRPEIVTQRDIRFLLQQRLTNRGES